MFDLQKDTREERVDRKVSLITCLVIAALGTIPSVYGKLKDLEQFSLSENVRGPPL